MAGNDDHSTQTKFKTRIKLKHDTEANWLKATTFVPMDGELIIYNADDTHTTPRFKVGDGTQVVGSLPFLADGIDSQYLRNNYIPIKEITSGPFQMPQIGYNKEIYWIDSNVSISANSLVQRDQNGIIYINPPDTVPESVNDYAGVNVEYLKRKAALLSADNTFTGTNKFTNNTLEINDGVDHTSNDGKAVIFSSTGMKLYDGAAGRNYTVNFPTYESGQGSTLATAKDLFNIYTTANSSIPLYTYGQVKTEQGKVTIGASSQGSESIITVANTIKLNAFGDTYIQLGAYGLSLNGKVSLDHGNPDRTDQMTISMPTVIDGNNKLKISDEAVSGNYVEFSASGGVTIKKDGTTTSKSLLDIGAGGSGDVTAAGNNTFTGSNTFSNDVTISTGKLLNLSANWYKTKLSATELLFEFHPNDNGSALSHTKISMDGSNPYIEVAGDSATASAQLYTYSLRLGYHSNSYLLKADDQFSLVNNIYGSSATTVTFPNKTGTVALTSDIKIKSASLDGTTLTLTI